ncbi:MAG: sensor histidine kinase, partial [Telluria sp.]
RKDVYIATLAHELRNPLAPIANAASLLRGKPLPQERIEWIAAMVGRQTAQMARLLDDLLDVTRISRGKIELCKEQVELASVVNQAVEAARSLVECIEHE